MADLVTADCSHTVPTNELYRLGWGWNVDAMHVCHHEPPEKPESPDIPGAIQFTLRTLSSIRLYGVRLAAGSGRP